MVESKNYVISNRIFSYEMSFNKPQNKKNDQVVAKFSVY